MWISTPQASEALKITRNYDVHKIHFTHSAFVICYKVYAE